MEKISILINNEMQKVKSVRYFELKNKKYFIYSFDEIDDQGYKTLYAVNVVTSDNVLIGSGIIEDNDWVDVVDIIKKVIKDNKENKPLTVEDLNEQELEGFPINGGRAFKLKKDLAELLGQNKKEFKKEEKVVETKQEDNSKERFDYLLPQELGFVEEEEEQINYQELYEKEQEKNKQLEQVIEKYKEKLNNIKNIIDTEAL